MKLSIIVPVYNEAEHIVTTLKALQDYRRQGHQLIVVDGHSQDDTLALARPLCDLAFSSEAGRARQMNAAAQRADGDALLFLHADTLLPADAPRLIEQALTNGDWGRFDVRLSGHQPLLRVVEFMMNLRSRVSGIATGDQAIFVRRSLFEDIGAYPAIPLMEDIALSKRLKQHAAPVCLNQRLITSSRRWEQGGILRTILLMWYLRLAYWLGADPKHLATQYK